MGEQGAALQKFNQELVKCIEEIKIKRAELMTEIERDEKVKTELEKELANIEARLKAINSSLEKKYTLKQQYDRTVTSSEAAYMKILESSQALLDMVRRESEVLLEDSYEYIS